MSDAMEPAGTEAERRPVADQPEAPREGMGNETVERAATPQSETAYSGHKVFIRKVENGFIVEVGCKVFVANTWSKVSEGLELYFKDPDAAWKKYIQKK